MPFFAEMSIVLENVIMFAPWALGMADAAVTAYYTNNLSAANLDAVRGTVVGEPGNALLGLGAASIAVQGWAVLEWIKHMVKTKEGKITFQNTNRKYGRAMMVFWWMLMLFYLLAIVMGALTISFVTDYGNQDITLDTTSGKVGGTFGDATEGMSYATLAVGGVAFFTYLYAEFFTRGLTEPHKPWVELHGGDN